jgi:hypothetical protein
MCPYCNQAVTAARVEAIELYEPDGSTLKGAKYSCPSCGKVLSLGIDPFAQADEIVLAVLAKLGKH